MYWHRKANKFPAYGGSQQANEDNKKCYGSSILNILCVCVCESNEYAIRMLAMVIRRQSLNMSSGISVAIMVLF